ncbi:MAG: helix-turn-helix domain-containing protein [Fibromonadaceae bacterium]|nr:helix-turn-helix domain-containing protein [Fibromonadaceae bacterium]
MQKLKDFRVRMRLTQQALAEILGLVGASAICDIEKNRANLTYPQIVTLLEMGATLDELFGKDFGYCKCDPPNDLFFEIMERIEKLEKKEQTDKAHTEPPRQALNKSKGKK